MRTGPYPSQNAVEPSLFTKKQHLHSLCNLPTLSSFLFSSLRETIHLLYPYYIFVLHRLIICKTSPRHLFRSLLPVKTLITSIPCRFLTFTCYRIPSIILSISYKSQNPNLPKLVIYGKTKQFGLFSKCSRRNIIC